MYFEKLEIDQMIYNEFLKEDKTQKESYGLYLVAMQKREQFLKNLPEELHEQFEEVICAHEAYEQEQCKEFARFVLSFIKSIFY